MEKGEITAFLSLIFVLMISFVTAILESASVQAEKNQARLDMDRAVYSVFGEYQKELLEEYGIFAVEGSYETGNFSEKQLIDRMHYYGASGIWPEVEGIQFLTDQNGQAFREGVVKYMEDLYGISIIQGLGALAEKWEQQEITGEQTKDESNQSLEELDDMLNQNQSSLPMENNPLPHIEQLKKSGLISLVFPKEKQVSQKQIRGEEQASSRALRVGRHFRSEVMWMRLQKSCYFMSTFLKNSEMLWKKKKKNDRLPMKWNIFWRERHLIRKIWRRC